MEVLFEEYSRVEQRVERLSPFVPSLDSVLKCFVRRVRVAVEIQKFPPAVTIRDSVFQFIFGRSECQFKGDIYMK